MSAELVLAQVEAVSPWRFQPHPEVWALIAFLAVSYWYAMTRIGPTVARRGEVVVSRRQVAWFAAGLLTLWAASDWPVHDIAEQYLYSVHMSQHLLLSFAAPPMFLLATPTWLARLVLGTGRGYRFVRRMARPIPATVAFNAVVVFSHWPAVVNVSVSNPVLHYLVHVAVVLTALLMWLPVAGPLPELRFSLPVQMIYLFLQSIIPTVPAGWLTFADAAVYKTYDIPTRVFGLSVTHDQQLAGMQMKVLAGVFLWTVIAILFIRFATRAGEDDRVRSKPLDRRAPVGTGPDGEVLTWEQVERELAQAGPAPVESPPPPRDG